MAKKTKYCTSRVIEKWYFYSFFLPRLFFMLCVFVSKDEKDGRKKRKSEKSHSESSDESDIDVRLFKPCYHKATVQIK